MYLKGMSNPANSIMGTYPNMTTLEGSSYANMKFSPIRTYIPSADVAAGYANGISAQDKALHDNGQIVFVSVRPQTGTSAPYTPVQFANIANNNALDTQFNTFFTNVYQKLTFVTGGRPSEIWFCFDHEIGSGASLNGQSNPKDFNAAWQHIRSLHDAIMNNPAINPSGIRRVKFVVIYTAFNISQGACDKFVPASNSWDYLGVDFYNESGYNVKPIGTFKPGSWQTVQQILEGNTWSAISNQSIVQWVRQKSLVGGVQRSWVIPEYNTVYNPNDVTAAATWMSAGHTWFKAQSDLLAVCYWLNNSGGGNAAWWNGYVLDANAAANTAGKNKYNAWLAAMADTGTGSGKTPNAPSVGASPVSNLTSSSASITITAPTQNTDSTTITNLSYLQMFRDGNASTKSPSGISPGQTYTFNPSGNTPGSTHVYTFKAFNTDGTSSAASSSVPITYNSTAGTPPATPTNLRVSNVDTDSATLLCDAPSGTVTGYQWYVDGATSPSYTSTTPSVTTDNVLSSNATHSFTVVAYNSSGASPASSSYSFSTLALPDTTAPPAPSTPTLVSIV